MVPVRGCWIVPRSSFAVWQCSFDELAVTIWYLEIGHFWLSTKATQVHGFCSQPGFQLIQRVSAPGGTVRTIPRVRSCQFSVSDFGFYGIPLFQGVILHNVCAAQTRCRKIPVDRPADTTNFITNQCWNNCR